MFHFLRQISQQQKRQYSKHVFMAPSTSSKGASSHALNGIIPMILLVLVEKDYLKSDHEDKKSATPAEAETVIPQDPQNEIKYETYYNLHSPVSSSIVPKASTNNKPIIQNTSNLSSSSICYCENKETMTQPSNHASSLRRHRTMVQLTETATPLHKLNKKYDVSWRISLGEGAFGTVHKAVHRKTKQKYAVKKISKKFTNSKSFQNEMSALMFIRSNGGHPYICSLRENYEDDSYYYLLFDFISGGEMFDHLIKMGSYSEADAARLVREVADALSFLHGIGIVHGDLKPENIMLSTDRKDDSVIQLVDFGCAHTITDDPYSDELSKEKNKSSTIKEYVEGGNTPAYSPPEAFLRTNKQDINPTIDMWSLGIILYIMLTGLHPFDLNGNATDDEIEERIKSRQSPPLRNSPITAHISSSALDVIERCIKWDPKDRITAIELLNHPWTLGETAKQEKIADASKKLNFYRSYKTKLGAKVFADFCTWSDDSPNDNTIERKKSRNVDDDDDNDASRKASLVERAFTSFDSQKKGFLTMKDFESLEKKDGDVNANLEEDSKAVGGEENLSLSGFSNLLSENMKNRYFPRGHVVYHEGDVGNHMYFINSGIIEVTTKDGSRAIRRQGDFFGEGALLHPLRIRSATITTITPVHTIEINREYFEKYLSSSEDLKLDLTEKDKTRKRNRAKTILRLQKNLSSLEFKKNDVLFQVGEEANSLFIIEDGDIDVNVDGKRVFQCHEGDIVGEHSLIMGRPRNTSAICKSKKCLVQEMKARDFYELYNSSSGLRTSLRELCLRREFQKALVKKTKKEFPNVKDLKKVFDAADKNKSGTLDVSEVSDLLKSFDPSLSEQEIDEVVQSLDLDKSGVISFDEFKLIFGMNESRAASI